MIGFGYRWSKDGPEKTIRVADAKEVGVGNPSEETCCHPDQSGSQIVYSEPSP